MLVINVLLLLIFIPAKFWMLHDLCPGLFTVNPEVKPRFLLEAPLVSGLGTFLMVLVILAGTRVPPYPFGFSLGCGLFDAGVVALLSFRFLLFPVLFKKQEAVSGMFPEVFWVTAGVLIAVTLHG